MLRKMLDPDGICGVNIEETRIYRNLAKQCSSLFANVAGELICQWTEGDDEDKIYFPSRNLDYILDYVNKPTGENDEEDLNKRSEGNVSTWNMEAKGSNPSHASSPSRGVT